MAANGTSFVQVKNLRGFTTVLQSAACEWFLIFLLLIDAVLSYLLTKFALYCKLQLPCILCSRLDHVLGNEKPGFYQNLLCSSHRTEISFLTSCHIHGKLGDGRNLCEECLLSSTRKTSNPDMHKLLLGKFGFNLGACGFQSTFLNGEFVPGSAGMRLCSCCNKPWRSRQKADRVSQLKSPRSGMTKPDIPLPRRLTHRQDVKKMRDRFSGSVTSCQLGKGSYDPLSHVGYTELKFTSDSESEFPFSDDDSGSIVFEVKEAKEESKVQHGSEVPTRTLANDMSPEKLIHHSSKPWMQTDVDRPCDVKCLVSNADAGNDLGELKWQQFDQKANPPALPELISLDDFPPFSNVMESPVEVSTEKCELKFPLSQNSNSSALSELMSLVDAPSSFNVVEGPAEASPQRKYADGNGISDFRNISINKHEEILKSVTPTAAAGIENDQVVNEVPPINSTFPDLSDMKKPFVNSTEREAARFMAEKITIKGPERVNEDLKLLPAENASVLVVETSLNCTVPIMKVHVDELQMNDAPSSTEVLMPQDSVSIERTEYSGLEPLSGSFISEIEGESIVDQLKRQVEYDKKRINAFYTELEEERSASAIAANQAMAMITRLQEEKATLHMEALQYLRMMEEQAEYDVDALEKANDLVAEKEKEIQDLEAELEFFRLKLPDESLVEIIPEDNFNLKGKNMTVKDTTLQYGKDDVNVAPSSMSSEVSNGTEKPICVKSSWSDFEEEKLFISRCLKGLEKRLNQYAHHRTSPYMSDGDYSEETEDRGLLKKGENLDKEGTQMNGHMKENGLLLQKDLSASNGSLIAQEKSNVSIGEGIPADHGNNQLISNGQNSSKQYKKINLVSVENEISDLNERLEALETDWNFLKHAFNSLQAGREGLQFVQEIARQLQELRKIGMSRCQSVS